MGDLQMTASSQQSDQGSPLTGIGRLVLLILATIIITHINFPHLFIEPTAEEWYEPQWVSPDEYKQYLVDVIKNPSSTVIWGFGGGKKLQTTAESIQQEISEQYPSCTMWVDSKRFNWQIQQEIFDMMSCEKGAILLQVEGDLLDKDILKFIEAMWTRLLLYIIMERRKILFL